MLNVSSVLRTLSFAIKCGCITHCIFGYLADFVVCSGISMEPTIYSGDIILTEHISPSLHDFHRNDIIVLRSPINPRNLLCKRLLALPGDRVNSGNVIPVGHLWISGDNGESSMDSSNYGPVPQGLVVGRAICKIWPIKSVQMLTRKTESV